MLTAEDTTANATKRIADWLILDERRFDSAHKQYSRIDNSYFEHGTPFFNCICSDWPQNTKTTIKPFTVVIAAGIWAEDTAAVTASDTNFFNMDSKLNRLC